MLRHNWKGHAGRETLPWQTHTQRGSDDPKK